MATTTKLSELTGHYVLDTVRTRIGFVARHTMATRVPGWFGAFEGGGYLDGDDPARSEVRFTMEANSIRTRNAQRDGLLVGKFLDAERHPVVTFASTAVERLDGDAFKLTGDLTIRGVTNPVTLDLVLTAAEHDPSGPRGACRISFAGGTTIVRTDWGVNWNAATALTISRKVVLNLDVTAVRQ
ncbi:YceI family protein [Streptodolium elevatio]|uniref:YceI family protein n=1 Tax=Streptodolium elevatio TaxID=3157996 RepID=A0ABV3DPK3_9ACTN